MTTEEQAFFETLRGALALYEVFQQRMLALFPATQREVQKTQIAFSNRYRFAFVSLPYRKSLGTCIVITFGLPCPIDSPRIAERTEAYPGRWTHHALISNLTEVDDELMNRLSASYDFSLQKRRGGRR